MLKKVNNFHFKIFVFTMLKETRKLNIIKHNKYIQNEFHITLLDYKNESGRYIIFDGKGKGKEYNAYNNELMFEGEYKNGRINGNGIEYQII